MWFLKRDHTCWFNCLRSYQILPSILQGTNGYQIASDGTVYIRIPNLVNTMSEDVFALNGAMHSEGAVLIKMSKMFLMKFLWLSVILRHICGGTVSTFYFSLQIFRSMVCICSQGKKYLGMFWRNFLGYLWFRATFLVEQCPHFCKFLFSNLDFSLDGVLMFTDYPCFCGHWRL